MLEFLRLFLVLAMLKESIAENILVVPFYNSSLAIMASAISNLLVTHNHSVTWLWPQGVETGKIMNNAEYGKVNDILEHCTLDVRSVII